MLELMVAFGLAAILLLGVTTTTTMTHNNTSAMHGIMYRDEVVRMVQQLASTPQTLQKTLALPANSDFYACVHPPGGTVQNPNCHSGTEYPVKLADTSGAAVTGAAAIPITDESLPGFPYLYSVMDGSLCRDGAGNPVAVANDRCAFEVVTSFVPTCTDTGSFCQDPHKIAVTIQYRVRLATGGSLKPLGGMQLASIIAPPAPLSYVNAMSVQLGYFAN